MRIPLRGPVSLALAAHRRCAGDRFLKRPCPALRLGRMVLDMIAAGLGDAEQAEGAY